MTIEGREEKFVLTAVCLAHGQGHLLQPPWPSAIWKDLYPVTCHPLLSVV